MCKDGSVRSCLAQIGNLQSKTSWSCYFFPFKETVTIILHISIGISTDQKQLLFANVSSNSDPNTLRTSMCRLNWLNRNPLTHMHSFLFCLYLFFLRLRLLLFRQKKIRRHFFCSSFAFGCSLFCSEKNESTFWFVLKYRQGKQNARWQNRFIESL